jgi:diaminopimelate decarboxylase
LAEEGLGADVSTLGELEFALRAGVPADRLVVHGNNKSDAELARAAEAGAAFVVLDALDEIERAAGEGVRRVLVRVTPGIEAETHEAIRTAHHGSKFGLPPDDALTAIDQARGAGLDVAGLHVHLGSQLLDLAPARTAVDWLRDFVAEAGWEPDVIDVGGGLGVAYVEQERAPSIEDFVGAILGQLGDWRPSLILEPGRSLVAEAGVTLYRVGVVKDAGETTFVAIDGGMSDNPRPQLYGAAYTAMLANRAGEGPLAAFTVCGKHCEAGDILIQRIELPEPRRGDLLAVPVTGAYTLGMASNYNGVPRPAAVLVADGEARLIRRRESVEDLLAHELAD